MRITPPTFSAIILNWIPTKYAVSLQFPYGNTLFNCLLFSPDSATNALMSIAVSLVGNLLL